MVFNLMSILRLSLKIYKEIKGGAVGGPDWRSIPGMALILSTSLFYGTSNNWKCYRHIDTNVHMSKKKIYIFRTNIILKERAFCFQNFDITVQLEDYVYLYSKHFYDYVYLHLLTLLPTIKSLCHWSFQYRDF